MMSSQGYEFTLRRFEMIDETAAIADVELPSGLTIGRVSYVRTLAGLVGQLRLTSNQKKQIPKGLIQSICQQFESDLATEAMFREEEEATGIEQLKPSDLSGGGSYAR